MNYEKGFTVRVDTRMIVHIDLPEDFIETLEEDMEREFKKATRQWGVHVPFEEKEILLNYAKKQTIEKVTDNLRSRWDYSPQIMVKVNSPRQGMEIRLPFPKGMQTPPARFIYSRDGWSVDQEQNEDAVDVADFAEHIEQQIRTWLRTAVFYGVASYAP